MFERAHDACEEFRKLPRIQIDPTFPNSSFDNWIGDYTKFFRRYDRSEIIDQYPARLFINDDIEIRNALLCSWGNSIVYITKNNNFNFGLILFVRNEFTGLKILGVTARFLDIKETIINDDEASAMFHEQLTSRQMKSKMHSNK